jgi:opacity protein-like surface antigen
MLNVSRSSCVRGLLLCLFIAIAGSTAKAQDVPETALDHQLSRVDLGVIGSGSFNGDASGTAITDGESTTVHYHAGNTLGALITVRYVKSPLLGLEFNYGYARYTDTFSPFGTITTPPSSSGIQQDAKEYTFGYVAHTRKQFFGVTPFAAIGLGTTEFSPTRNGGQRYYPQARASYYYSVGAETTVLSPHFGLRAQFRQVFFKAPDFETNFLTIQQHTSTIEPGFGFFLRF